MCFRLAPLRIFDFSGLENRALRGAVSLPFECFSGYAHSYSTTSSIWKGQDRRGVFSAAELTPLHKLKDPDCYLLVSSRKVARTATMTSKLAQ
ncbi:hypothetical protein Y032_0047g1527 [Ancylostoma ceylanicum]|uniref:Uncharacterized protein n=1 Tax=Ancylostoma ceylanicum TaxID=53326 RepID=A0A016UCH8_9BILA|nr:hypothetical protein Y032_0047g1527 [Ancylostoma ceylanicum]